MGDGMEVRVRYSSRWAVTKASMAPIALATVTVAVKLAILSCALIEFSSCDWGREVS